MATKATRRVRRGLAERRAEPTADLADRIGRVLLGFAALLIATIGATVVATTLLLPDTDRSALSVAVEEVTSESVAVTESFFSAGPTTASALDRAVARSTDEAGLVAAMETLVRVEPSIDGIFIGRADGSFLYVTRGVTLEPDGLRVKRVETTPRRIVTEIQVDREGTPLQTSVLPNDDYDPRTRPWYVAAEAAPSGWTQTYQFASSGELGVTHFQQGESFALDGLVIGVDLRLTEIVDFLDDRRPGRSGIAAVISADGDIVAERPDLVPPALIERAQALASVPASGSETLDVLASNVADGVAALSPVAGGDWVLAVQATDDDFAGAFTRFARRVRAIVPIVGLALIGLVFSLASLARSQLGRLRRRATIDDQSGLLTRAEGHRRLEQMIADSDGLGPLTVAIIKITAPGFAARATVDLDTLSGVAEQLGVAGGEHGFAARVGPSEFLWVNRSPDPGAAVAMTRARVIDALAGSAVATPERTVHVGWTTEDRSCDYAEDCVPALLRQAILALTAAETRSAGLVQYTDSLQLPALADERRRRQLEDAIEACAFTAHFQPEIDLDTGEVIGAEALMRRIRRNGEPEIAGAFIDDLERFGLMPRVVHTVIDEAVDFARRFCDYDDFTVRLNLGADELNDPSVVHRLWDLVRMPQASWSVEITERTIEGLNGDTIEQLRGLRDQGLDLALDDFGTGYSSMSELKRLPISTIKIDRSFVDPLGAKADPVSIAALVSEVAHRLSLDLVAEGIETEAQRSALGAIGCRRGQGWLFAPAMAPNDFAQWCARSADTDTDTDTDTGSEPDAARSQRPGQISIGD